MLIMHLTTLLVQGGEPPRPLVACCFDDHMGTCGSIGGMLHTGENEDAEWTALCEVAYAHFGDEWFYASQLLAAFTPDDSLRIPARLVSRWPAQKPKGRAMSLGRLLVGIAAQDGDPVPGWRVHCVPMAGAKAGTYRVERLS